MRYVQVLFACIVVALLASYATPAYAFGMDVSCYGSCGTGYNPLYGNTTCSNPDAFFTGEDYTMAGTPTFAPGSIVLLTNIDPADDDYGASVSVLVDDCHYGYARPDISSAAFGTIQEYAAGVAYVDAEVIRNGWDGAGNACTTQYGYWVC